MRPLLPIGLATWMLLIASAATAADPLQRLFTTPPERAALDRLRAEGVDETNSIHQAEEKTAPAKRLKVNGYVLRRDGKNVVWVNNHSTLKEDPSLADVTVDSGRIDKQRVPVHLPEGKVYLKPGQVYARGVGTVTESYLVKDAPAVTVPDAGNQDKSEASDAAE